MVAARAAIATTGHNISNANTEGFSRQTVENKTAPHTGAVGSNAVIGAGTLVARVGRVNDDYVEKQIRNAARDLAHFEEKDVLLRQTEDIFNELNGDGINRLVAKYFNEFRRLSNEPENEAVRQSVREASQSLVNDFHRLRKEVDEVRNHIDARMEGYAREVNSNAEMVRDLNIKIKSYEIAGAPPNDLLDQRDLALKRLGSYMDLNAYKDNGGGFVVDVRGVGPLVVGGQAEKFSVARTAADDQGKIDNSIDLRSSGSVSNSITHLVKGGKIGALVEVRDKVLSSIQAKLDEMAYTLSNAVNDIHQQGFTANGVQGVNYFKKIDQIDRAASFIELSDEVKDNVNNIAAAAIPDAAADNRIAIAISSLQGAKMMNGGKATMDDWYNSIVSDVGVINNKNKFNMNQEHDIVGQLNKIREQISGVSIDEETANLMQFQHAFDASAKVIQVADECLKTVLELRR